LYLLGVLCGGAEIEKKPDRQIAEPEAEFETVEQSVTGKDLGAAPDPDRGGRR